MRRLGGDDDVARADPLLRGLDDEVPAVGPDGVDPAARAGTLADSRPSAAGSRPDPPRRLRAINERVPPHTSANSPIPHPADSSSSSAVARCAAQAKMSFTAGGADRLHRAH